MDKKQLLKETLLQLLARLPNGTSLVEPILSRLESQGFWTPIVDERSLVSRTTLSAKEEPEDLELAESAHASKLGMPNDREYSDLDLSTDQREQPPPEPFKNPLNNPPSSQQSHPLSDKLKPEEPPSLPQIQKLSLEKDTEMDIDECIQTINLIGETISHGQQNLKGIDKGWLVPCFFLYHKFYRLREKMLKQYVNLLHNGDASEQQVDQIKKQNGMVKQSLQQMSKACVKRSNDQSLKEKLSEQSEQLVTKYLYQHVQEYVKEVPAKEATLSPENFLKVKLHLLEILNSLLVVQFFEGRQTKSMSAEELTSETTRMNIDELLEMHLTEVRRHSGIKH